MKRLPTKQNYHPADAEVIGMPCHHANDGLQSRNGSLERNQNIRFRWIDDLPLDLVARAIECRGSIQEELDAETLDYFMNKGEGTLGLPSP